MKKREHRNNEAFREFTHEIDYLNYVDGKPRYAGVKSFLKSRGIDIPYGKVSDSPEIESLCGLGNKKNRIFYQLINSGRIEVYKSTIRFIHTLRENGVNSKITKHLHTDSKRKQLYHFT